MSYFWHSIGKGFELERPVLGNLQLESVLVVGQVVQQRIQQVLIGGGISLVGIIIN